MHILKHILNIIFPTLCKHCGGTTNNSTFTPSFCNICWDEIEWFDGPCCPQCGVPYPSIETPAYPFPVSSAHTCGECIKNPPYFDRVISAGPYKDVLAEAIKLFKYKKKIHIGRALAEEVLRIFSEENPPVSPFFKGGTQIFPPLEKGGEGGFETCSSPDFKTPDCLIPVPLHPLRLREREFNQSSIIASVISSKSRIPLFTDILMRQRYTKPQVELGFRDRKENVTSAFTVYKNEIIKGKDIILVDDVYTTGSTVNECAKVLKKNGAGKVYVVTIARMV